MKHDEIAREVLAMVRGKALADHTEVCNAWLYHLAEIVLEWPEAMRVARAGARFDGVIEGMDAAAEIAAGTELAAKIREAADNYVPGGES